MEDYDKEVHGTSVKTFYDAHEPDRTIVLDRIVWLWRAVIPLLSSHYCSR